MAVAFDQSTQSDPLYVSDRWKMEALGDRPAPDNSQL
jgi:hypothetical protein